MAKRFEWKRVFSMSSPRGVDRIVSTLFASNPLPAAGAKSAVIVALPLSNERGPAGPSRASPS